MSFSAARNRAGITQREAAEKLGVSPAAVAQWDTGKTMPRASLLPEIATLYGCSVDDLLAQEMNARNEQ